MDKDLSLSKGFLIIVLGYIIYTMVVSKPKVKKMNGNSYANTNMVEDGSVDPSVDPSVKKQKSDALMGSNGDLLATVGEGVGTRSVAERCSQPGNWVASNLLPKVKSDNNSMFKPTELGKQNFLEAAKFIGTQGSTCRNANLQLRGDPPIKKGNVSPWLQSTIEPCKQNGVGIAG